MHRTRRDVVIMRPATFSCFSVLLLSLARKLVWSGTCEAGSQQHSSCSAHQKSSAGEMYVHTDLTLLAVVGSVFLSNRRPISQYLTLLLVARVWITLLYSSLRSRIPVSSLNRTFRIPFVDMAKQKPSDDFTMVMSPCDRPVSILKSSSSWSSFVSCGPTGMVWSPIHEQQETNLMRPARKVSFESASATDPLRGLSSSLPCTPDHTACFYSSRNARHMKVNESPAPAPPPVPTWRLMEDRKVSSPSTEPALRTPPHRPVPQRPPLSPKDRKSSHLFTVDTNAPTQTIEWPQPRSDLYFLAIDDEESKCTSPLALEKALGERSQGGEGAAGFLLHWERSMMTSGDAPPPLIPALLTTKQNNLHDHSLNPVDLDSEELSKIPPKLPMRLIDPTNRPFYGL